MPLSDKGKEQKNRRSRKTRKRKRRERYGKRRINRNKWARGEMGKDWQGNKGVEERYDEGGMISLNLIGFWDDGKILK